MKLTERIEFNWIDSGRNYHRLMRMCFPPNKYPKAWRVSSNGGPPGCAMAFGAALRRMGIYRDGDTLFRDLPSVARAQATWTVELNVECSKCGEYFDAMNTPDFWDGRKLEIGESSPHAGDQRVDCPKCGQELTLELVY